MAIDYTRSEIDVLIDLIRHDNENKILTSSQVTFGTPSTFTPVPGVDRNTLVIGTSVAGRGYEGSQSFYYNRVKLIDFVDQTDPDQLVYYIGTETTLADLLPTINERYGINLTIDKIINKPLPAYVDYAAQVVLQVVPTSLVYINQLTLQLYPVKTPLSDELTVTNLDGFVMNSGDVNIADVAPITNIAGFDVES